MPHQEQQLSEVGLPLKALKLGLLALGFALFAPLSIAQSDSSTVDEESVIALDDSPFVSARAAGMANALSPVADSTDAPYFNPAGIGNTGEGKGKRPPLVRQLDFPYIGAAATDSSIKLYKEYEKEGGPKKSKAMAVALLNTTKGQRQYGRISLFPNMVLGRLMVGPIIDEQIAAVSKGSDTNEVAAHYRSVSGIGAGLSVSDPKGRLSLGAFGTVLNRKEIKGTFDFLKVVDPESRKAALESATTQTSAAAGNLGMIWRIAETGSPRLAVVMKDAGNTHYRPSDNSKAETVVQQDLTAGLSLSPRLGSIGVVNIVAEGKSLTDKYTAVNKKFRLGTELLLGIHSGRPLFSLRAGYNLAGMSAGITLDVGLISLQYANQAEDIGVGNIHMVERRHVAVLAINVAEF